MADVGGGQGLVPEFTIGCAIEVITAVPVADQGLWRLRSVGSCPTVLCSRDHDEEQATHTIKRPDIRARLTCHQVVAMVATTGAEAWPC